MGLQCAELRRGRVEYERDRAGGEPLSAVADEEAKHALLDQRVQFREILVSVQRGFVQGSLVALMWAIPVGM